MHTKNIHPTECILQGVLLKHDKNLSILRLVIKKLSNQCSASHYIICNYLIYLKYKLCVKQGV